MEPSFSFPFQPYPIQETFMRELYLTIEHSKLGIFESPTGTGKSLSICCGALQWLKDYNKKTLENVQNEIAQLKAELASLPGDASEDWLQEEYEKLKKNQTLCTLQSKLEQLKRHNDKLNEIKLRVSKAKSNVNKNYVEFYFQNTRKNKLENDIISETENIQEEKENEEDRDLLLDDAQEEDQMSDEEDITEDNIDTIKLYISSRTHSQLSQMVGEIKRTAFRDSTRVVTLASRLHYCINADVRLASHNNVHLINETCLDLQKSKSKVTKSDRDGQTVKKSKTRSCSSCPYYNQSNISRLKDRMLVDILDMEDLVKCGKELKACPYYASRMALDDAEVVLMSHSGLVSSGARSGLRLTLTNHVVIVDEAHGLTAALESAHAAPLSYKQLTAVNTYLQLYVNKYRARLTSHNLLTLNQMGFIVGKLLGMIKGSPNENKSEEAQILTLQEFVMKAEIDHMNLRPLVEFCRATRLAPKLHGFSMRYSQEALEEEMRKTEVKKKSSLESFLKNISKKKDEAVVGTNVEVKAQQQSSTATSAGSALYAVLDFLERLCDRSDHGRVLLAHTSTSSQLKYLLLNPAEHFADVVAQCRSVIVAGGTMEPVSEFVSLLAPRALDRERVTVVRCDHVVPPENVLAVCLSKGPNNAALNFTYEHRMDKELLCGVAGILRNVSALVAGGVVVFVPSYAYEQTLYHHLLQGGVIDAIARRKAVFREPKSAADVDQVLGAFAAAVRDRGGGRNGALLLSVVGGKLSEGLNFSDDLGRCVVVVGMPYPNAHSAELVEKMSYLDRTAGGGSGAKYYESLCMKAVNQCVGRAVRHARDYACVLLVDERYSRAHTVAALPAFVRKSIVPNCAFGPAIGNIAKFFSKHKNKS